MKKITIRVAIMSYILLLFAGCGLSDSGMAEAPDATAASGIEQGDVGNADNGHITQSLVTLPDATQSPGALPEADGQYIGNEAAKQIALKHAGLTESEVWFVHAHLELDDGSWKYDVDADTGSILSFEKELD